MKWYILDRCSLSSLWFAFSSYAVRRIPSHGISRRPFVCMEAIRPHSSNSIVDCSRDSCPSEGAGQKGNRISPTLKRATLHSISTYPFINQFLFFLWTVISWVFCNLFPAGFCPAVEMGSVIEFLLGCIVVLSCSVAWASAGVYFSSLPNTLGVTATINSSTTSEPNVAMAGRDQLVVSWWVNESSSPLVDLEYRNVKVELCFAPASQVDRKWRSVHDDLTKDKTCKFDISEEPYNSRIRNNTTRWTVEKDVPKGLYFVRAYALNALGNEVAYGQSTNKNKTTNLFMVDPISGRHASLDIAALVFSAFSIVSLLGFFILEKWSAKKTAAQKK